MSDIPLVDAPATRGCIEVADVSKTYRLGQQRVEALRGVELRIAEPGFYAVMGPSGSGKSTLLHLLAGLDRPDAGRLVVAGRAVHEMNEARLTLYRRHDVGIVFQQFNLISTLTALENVTLPGMLDGLGRAELEHRGRELLEALGLAERARHRPDALSGGEQQRCAIARALLFRPQVLLADEPTGNLDAASSDQMWRLLDELVDRFSMTIVMVTHEPSAAVHCRRVFVLRSGKIGGTFDVEGKDAAELAACAQQLLR